MITPQQTELLLAIARAGGIDGDWSPVLRELVLQTRAEDARLWQDGRVWTATDKLVEALPQVYGGLRLGRVYTGEELAERALGQAHAGDQRALGVRGPKGPAWIVLRHRSAAFRAVDSALLSSLAPHFEQALAVAHQMASLRDDLQDSARLARQIQVGRVRFGPLGEVVALDPVARDLLARAGAILPAAGLSGAGLVTLSPTLEMLCLSDQAYLRATDAPLPAPERIAHYLGLSLPEARLVRALGQGASLREAAQALGLTIETARYYSKQIFAKTGLRGQADLVRRLWTGVLMLG